MRIVVVLFGLGVVDGCSSPANTCNSDADCKKFEICVDGSCEPEIGEGEGSVGEGEGSVGEGEGEGSEGEGAVGEGEGEGALGEGEGEGEGVVGEGEGEGEGEGSANVCDQFAGALVCASFEDGVLAEGWTSAAPVGNAELSLETFDVGQGSVSAEGVVFEGSDRAPFALTFAPTPFVAVRFLAKSTTTATNGATDPQNEMVFITGANGDAIFELDPDPNGQHAGVRRRDSNQVTLEPVFSTPFATGWHCMNLELDTTSGAWNATIDGGVATVGMSDALIGDVNRVAIGALFSKDVSADPMFFDEIVVDDAPLPPCP